MAKRLDKIEEVLEFLRNYNGNNTYLLMIKRDVFVYKNALTPLNIEFVLNNRDIEPLSINKITKIPDWYGKTLKEKYEIEDITPTMIKVVSYLGQTETTYCCYIQYRQSVPPQLTFVPKKAVLNNFFVQDYTKDDYDFDRYAKLAKSNGENRVLYQHQKDGVKFLLSRKRCILADDMGTGKTTTLSVAAIEGNFDSILIICPASLKTTWRNELKLYIPQKDITIIESGIASKTKPELEEFLGYAIGKSGLKRVELIKEAEEQGKWKNNRFVIINYDILKDFYDFTRAYTEESKQKVLDNSPLLKYIHNRKSCIIIDEAHTLSNNTSKYYKVIKNIIKKGNPDCVFLATGTPVTNRPFNLFCLLDLIDSEITSNQTYYMERYCDGRTVYEKDDWHKCTKEYIENIGKKYYSQLTEEEKDALNLYISKHAKIAYRQANGATNLDELSEAISHIYLRRTKDDVVDLPEKHVHEQFYNLTPWQEDEYNTLWDDYERAYKEAMDIKKDELEKEWEERETKAIERGDEKELKKINDERALFEEKYNQKLNKALLEGGRYRRYLSSEMVPNTIHLCNKILETENKVIIACCYDEELYKLKEYYGKRAVIYNGKCSQKEKDRNKDMFLYDPNVNVFIGNIDSASMGLTLINSCNLIFNNLDWTPALDNQMMDRIHRIGQTRECHIYVQLFRDTQYEYMWNVVLKKQFISNKLIKKEAEK